MSPTGKDINNKTNKCLFHHQSTVPNQPLPCKSRVNLPRLSFFFLKTYITDDGDCWMATHQIVNHSQNRPTVRGGQHQQRSSGVDLVSIVALLERQSPSQSMARTERSVTRARVPVVPRCPKRTMEIKTTTAIKHLRFERERQLVYIRRMIIYTQH